MQNELLIYAGAVIIGLVIFGLVIRWAVRADSIVSNQRAMIAFLMKLCEKQGVSPDTLDGLKNTYGVK